MIGARTDEVFEALLHLLRRAVNARSVSTVRIAIYGREPAIELGARGVGSLVHRQEHALADRELRGITPGLLQRFLQDRNALTERLDARASGTHPRVGERRRTTHGIRVIAAE